MKLFLIFIGLHLSFFLSSNAFDTLYLYSHEVTFVSNDSIEYNVDIVYIDNCHLEKGYGILAAFNLFEGSTEELKSRECKQNFDSLFINNNSYKINSDDVFLDYIFCKKDSSVNINFYTFEIKSSNDSSLVAIDYGSTRNENQVYQNYIMVCDSSNPYASEYIGANLTFTQIFNSGGGFLWEITDDDRDDMLVGLKYKSPFGAQIYEKFLVPNP
jgi:hypothetical protein